jgi:Ni/Fe-hydrogenase subunit HybB-like protein
MKQTTRDVVTTWVAASVIWVSASFAAYELLNVLLGRPAWQGIQSRPLFVISGAIAAGFIAVAAGYVARQRVISYREERLVND